MSKAKFEPGEGFGPKDEAIPLTWFLTPLETTLSRKGRG